MAPLDDDTQWESSLPETPFSKGPRFRISPDYCNPLTLLLALVVGVVWLVKLFLG